MAIPENRKIPTEQLIGIEAVIDGRVLPANLQIINLNGLATIATVYRITETSIIDFRTSGQRLDDSNPIYDTFTIPDTYLLKTNLLNKWDIFFSCNTVPAIISSPAAWLTITGTILTGYANLNRITFLLDQVYNATTDIFELKVICNITQAEGANADPEPPIA